MGERQDEQRWVEETRAEYLWRTTPAEASEEWLALAGFLVVACVVVAALVVFDVAPAARSAWGKWWQ